MNSTIRKPHGGQFVLDEMTEKEFEGLRDVIRAVRRHASSFLNDNALQMADNLNALLNPEAER